MTAQPPFGKINLLPSALVALSLFVSAQQIVPAQRGKMGQLQAIRRYIKQNWRILSRSNAQLAVAAVDPKFPTTAKRWPVYVARSEDRQRVERRLRAEMKPNDFAQIELRQLPITGTNITQHGLLYVPHPYVVPGGRFNEMYGWDSYFIQVGLLRDGETVLARHMIDVDKK